MHSERLATTISAELIEWRLRENGAVEGVIYNSIDRTYRDGDKMLFLNTKLQHWTRADGFWSDHYIMTTETGLHFMLKDKDMLRNGG